MPKVTQVPLVYFITFNSNSPQQTEEVFIAGEQQNDAFSVYGFGQRHDHQKTHDCNCHDQAETAQLIFSTNDAMHTNNVTVEQNNNYCQC